MRFSVFSYLGSIWATIIRLHWSRMRLERQMLLIGMGHDKPNVTKITSFRWNNVGIRVSPPPPHFFKRVEERRRGSHAVFGFDRFYNFFFSFAALNDFKWCSTSVLDVTLDVSYDTYAKRCACDIEIQRRDTHVCFHRASRTIAKFYYSLQPRHAAPKPTFN